MLAGAASQPRLDRVLARCIDLAAYGLYGFAVGIDEPVGQPPRPFSDGRILILAVVAVLVVLLLEVVPLALGKPSPGKALFALRIESADGEPLRPWQAGLRASPLACTLIVFVLSLETSIQVWWITLGLATVLGLSGLVSVIRDRPTPWDRLARTRVVPVPARW